MTTQEVANRLVEICRTGQFDNAYTELFAENATAIEPPQAPMPQVTGLQNLLEKGKQFSSMVETVHSSYVSDPIVAGNHFSITMGMDYTNKEGQRINMEEVCVYEVKDGKVVKEQFFY